MLPKKVNLPMVVLFNENHTAHRVYGAVNERGDPVPALYVTDRFGELVYAFARLSGAPPPNINDVLKELEFVNHVCPECEPPEWPR